MSAEDLNALRAEETDMSFGTLLSWKTTSFFKFRIRFRRRMERSEVLRGLGLVLPIDFTVQTVYLLRRCLFFYLFFFLNK